MRRGCRFLLFVDEYLFTIHDIQTLGGVCHLATLQVIDLSIAVGRLCLRHLDARHIALDGEELTCPCAAAICQVCFVGTDGSASAKLVEAHHAILLAQYVGIAWVRDVGRRAHEAVARVVVFSTTPWPLFTMRSVISVIVIAEPASATLNTCVPEGA